MRRASEIVMSFVEFIGVAERRGAIVRLVADGADGFLEFASQDVRAENGRIYVRDGAVASAVGEPASGNPDDRPSVDAIRERCPSGITCCIGAVHVCCDDFRVLGSCIGAWGCARRRFIPD